MSSWVGGGMGRVGGGQNSTIGTQTMAPTPISHATSIGHRDVQLTVGGILGSHRLIGLQCNYSSRDFGELAKCPPKKQTI